MTQFWPGVTVALFKVTVFPPGFATSEADAPQFCRAFAGRAGLAIATFAGRLSVNEVPVSERFGFVLSIVIVNMLVCPTHIVLGENDLFIVGDWTPMTVSVALAGVVFVMETPPPVELNALAGIVLIKLPTVVEVTSIPTVHSPGVIPTCAGTVPPLSDNVVVPGAAVTAPPHVLDIFAGFAIDNPGCTPTKLSVHEALVSENEFGL